MSVHGLSVLRQQPFFDTTNVTRLEIVCLQAMQRLEHAPVFYCPALEHLIVTVSWDTNASLPSALRASDVASFITRHLDRSAANPIALTIRGAELEHDSPELLTLVRDLTVNATVWPMNAWWTRAYADDAWGVM